MSAEMCTDSRTLAIYNYYNAILTLSSLGLRDCDIALIKKYQAMFLEDKEPSLEDKVAASFMEKLLDL